MKKKVSLKTLNSQINRLIAEQRKLLDVQTRLSKSQKAIMKEESAELSGIHQLKRIQQEMARYIEPHPLRKLTLQDVARGIVGSVFGVLAHFTFFYGVKVAQQLTLTRALLLFPLSLVIGAVFLYATGFRKVPKRYLWYLPVRLFVLLVISIVMATIILAIFEPGFGMDINLAIKEVATVSLVGLLGAITADLIGKAE